MVIHRIKVSYEWDIETVSADEHEDVLDHNFRDRLRDFGGEEMTLAMNFDGEEPGTFTRLVLVRTEGNEVEGITDRFWAYVTEDGKLPEYFQDATEHVTGIRVPKRLREEFAV